MNKKIIETYFKNLLAPKIDENVVLDKVEKTLKYLEKKKIVIIDSDGMVKLIKP